MRVAEKILVVDDEPSLVQLVEYNLRQAGFDVVTALDGEAAVEAAGRENPDLIVLDLMLPKLDGFEVCRIIRRKMTIPIIMLTARSDEVDRIVGLELGADDYVVKPFSPRELVARVKAILRRSAPERTAGASAIADGGRQADGGGPAAGSGAARRSLSAGDLLIDLDRHSVTRDGQPIPLTYTEFKILSTLAASPGIVFSRDTLMNRVWGEDFFGDSRTVDVHVRHLRQKLQEAGADESLIETVRGVGYRFREAPSGTPADAGKE
ncbi:MAG TPA: response regulator transcription factor [Bacillota bacterium]